jgi:hypothetical protein
VRTLAMAFVHGHVTQKDRNHHQRGTSNVATAGGGDTNDKEQELNKQASIQSWQCRHEFLVSTFHNLKSILVDRNRLSSPSSQSQEPFYYQIHMYLPYEYMMDLAQGPVTVLQWATLQQNASSNFPVPCFILLLLPTTTRTPKNEAEYNKRWHGAFGFIP